MPLRESFLVLAAPFTPLECRAKGATIADYTRVYTTDIPPSAVLELAEAYLVGLRGFSVPSGHEPTQDSAEFRLRGGLLVGLFAGHPTVRLTTEKRGAKSRLTITANRKQLLEAMDAWAVRELGARPSVDAS